MGQLNLFGAKESPSSGFRLLTWNIGGGIVESKKEEDIDYFIKEIKRERPAIVCLQEVTARHMDARQTERMARETGLDYVIRQPHSPSHLSEDGFLEVTILSRFPVNYWKFYRLPYKDLPLQGKEDQPTKRHDKGFLRASLQVSGQELIVLCGHTVPFEIFGRDAMEFPDISREMERIITLERKPTVVGADFNYENLQRLIPDVYRMRFTDALEGDVTTPHKGAVDHILYNDFLRCRRYRIKKKDADHHLCYADFKLSAYR